MADHLVAHRGDADAHAPSDQLADHPRARISLPRTRRTLNGKYGVIELGRDSRRKLNRGFAGLDFKDAASQSRRSTEEQIARRSISRGSRHGVVTDVLPNAQHGLREGIRIDHRVSENGGRMYIRLVTSLLDIDGVLAEVDARDRPECGSVRVWEMKLVLLADIRLLRRK